MVHWLTQKTETVGNKQKIYFGFVNNNIKFCQGSDGEENINLR